MQAARVAVLLSAVSTAQAYAGSDLTIPFNPTNATGNSGAWGTIPYCTDAPNRCCCNDADASASVLGTLTVFAGTLSTAACTNVDQMLCLIKSAGENVSSIQAGLQKTAYHNGDRLWVIIAGALVFFMQCGFAMLEAGSVRRKSTQNIIFKNVCDAGIAATMFYFVGYGIAYSGPRCETGDWKCTHTHFMGNRNFMLYDENTDDSGKYMWFFQFAFAATAATIVSGAMAERTQIFAYVIYSSYITVFVYPTVVHWVWSTHGWLSAFSQARTNLGPNGMIDFAGSGVVHMVGGFAALVGAYIVGPRIGRFPEEGKKKKKKDEGSPYNENEWKGQSTMLACLGTFILWFGWYGFNCGSTLAMNGELAGKVATTTTLSAAMGGITAVLVSKAIDGHWSVPNALNGVLAGLVSITAPCATVDEWHAIIIGCIGGIVYFAAAGLLVYCKIDDPLGAFPVHGACGVWGCLSVGVFSTTKNFKRAYGDESAGYDPEAVVGGKQFGVQLCGVVSIIAWTVITTGVLFFVLDKLEMLRVSKEEEEKGLDACEHGAVSGTKSADSTAGFFGALSFAPIAAQAAVPVAEPVSNAPDAPGQAKV